MIRMPWYHIPYKGMSLIHIVYQIQKNMFYSAVEFQFVFVSDSSENRYYRKLKEHSREVTVKRILI